MHFYAMACGERTLRTRWLGLSLVALVLVGVGGCGGGGGSKILYALGLGSPNVTILTVSGSGTLTVSNSVSTGAAPDAIGIDPLLRFAYIVDSGSGSGLPGGVSQYVLNRSSGSLVVATLPASGGTSSPSTPIETGVGPVAIAIDSTGTFVFVANTGAVPANPACSLTPSVCVPSISVYTIDPTGGALTEVKQPTTTPPTLNCMPNQPVPCPLPLPPSAVPSALAITGSMLFVANSGAGSVSAYPFNSGGALDSTKVVTTTIGGSPSAMSMDPSGKLLFITDPVASTVAAFSTGSSGQLTAVGMPLAAGTTPVSVALRPAGNFLYTANRGSNNVSAFSFDGSGALTKLSDTPVAPGSSPSYVTTDASGSFLFVANSGSNNISVFSIDSSGALKQVTGSPFASPVINPIALASIN